MAFFNLSIFVIQGKLRQLKELLDRVLPTALYYSKPPNNRSESVTSDDLIDASCADSISFTEVWIFFQCCDCLEVALHLTFTFTHPYFPLIFYCHLDNEIEFTSSNRLL